MKTLEEKIADCIEHELRNTNIWWKGDIVKGVQALLDDATTPRTPKPEWFEKWPSWWILASNGTEAIAREIRPFQSHDKATGLTYDCIRDGEEGIGYQPWWMLKDIDAVVPIAQIGLGFAGWQVVE